MKKKLFLSLTIIAVIVCPFLSGLIIYNGNYPDGFFHYPPTEITTNDEFHLPTFIGIIITCLLISTLYFFPKLFGFKVAPRSKSFNKISSNFPVWFWIGLVLWLPSLVFSYLKVEYPLVWNEWLLIPLWWGFILILDGLVYLLNKGNSLLSNSPKELIFMAFSSISGWLIFDFFNFYIINWYYPKGDLISHYQFKIYAILGSTAFIPMSFQWYHLIRKLKIFDRYYSQGPKIRISRNLKYFIIALLFILFFIAPFFSSRLFFIIWLSPVFILAIVMSLLKMETPFDKIGSKGDWTFVLVFGLTFLIQGVILEWWNFISGTHEPNGTFSSYNPAYWLYNVVNAGDVKLFEMPVPGYFGYILFSIHCWLWYKALSEICGLETKFCFSEDFL